MNYRKKNELHKKNWVKGFFYCMTFYMAIYIADFTPGKNATQMIDITEFLFPGVVMGQVF